MCAELRFVWMVISCSLPQCATEYKPIERLARILSQSTLILFLRKPALKKKDKPPTTCHSMQSELVPSNLHSQM